MNKDLSKEYKEAVLNDLPDLWGRIEAAIDAEEAQSAQTENRPVEKPVNVVEFKSVEKKVNENKNAKQKKKFKIPSWVLIGLPTVAILLIIVVPVAALGVLGLVFGAAGSKNSASEYSYSAEPASVATSDPMEMRDDIDSSYAVDEWDYDARENIEDAMASSETASVYEDEDTETDFKSGADNNDNSGRQQASMGQNKNDVPGMVSDSEEELPHSVDSYMSDDKVKFKNEWLYLYNIENQRNNLNTFIANENLTITVDNLYQDGSDIIAECTITEKGAEDNPVYHGFPGFTEGESFKAYIYEPFEVGKEYKIALVLVSNIGEDQYFEIWQLEE